MGRGVSEGVRVGLEVTDGTGVKVAGMGVAVDVGVGVFSVIKLAVGLTSPLCTVVHESGMLIRIKANTNFNFVEDNLFISRSYSLENSHPNHPGICVHKGDLFPIHNIPTLARFNL